MIITYIGKDCKSYREEIKEIYKKEWICPECHKRAYIHCKYIRKVIEINGVEVIEEIKIVRIKCSSKECNKTHSILPDFLCPNKRYKAEDIAETIEIYEEEGNIKEVKTSAEESTVWRWIKVYKKKIETIHSELEKILLREYFKHMSLLDYELKGIKRIRGIVNKMQEIKSSNLIGKMNQILSSNGVKIYI
jgi:hypothetical protein